MNRSNADIAKHRMLPLDFVRWIGGDLMKADISLSGVVRAMEAGIALNPCVSHRRVCPLAAHCPVQSVWVGATQRLGSARLKER